MRAHEDGTLTPEALANVDVLVIPHCSDEEWETTTGVGSPAHTSEELAAIEDFVAAGGGLIVLAETEQKKYGNVLGDLAGRFGIEVVSTTVQDPVHRFKDVSTWVLGQPGPKTDHDLLAEVSGACFYRAGVLRLTAPEAFGVLVTSSDATVPGAPLIAAVPARAGRVVVAADSDLFGDDSIADLEHRRLWLNLVTWAGTGRAGSAASVADASGALQTQRGTPWLPRSRSCARCRRRTDRSRGGTPRARGRPGSRHCGGRHRTEPPVPPPTGTSRRNGHRLPGLARRRPGRAGLPRLVAAVPPRGRSSRRRRAPRGVPDVHPERQPQPQRRSRRHPDRAGPTGSRSWRPATTTTRRSSRSSS